MDKDTNKLPDEFKYEPETKIGKKLDNFWYYHKWKVIVGIFIAVIVIICAVQCATREETDITLVYAGPYGSYNESVAVMNSELTKIMPEELGDNGAVLNVLEMYTAEQIEALAKKEVDEYLAETKEKLSEEEINTLITRQKNSLSQLTSTNSKNFSSFLQIGSYSIYLLDPSIYEQYKSLGVFAKLSDVFGNDIPDSAYSEDAIKLSETEFYKKSVNGIGDLPEDTLLCIRIKPVIGSGCNGNKNNKDYAKAVEMFKAIVNYK